MDINSLLGQINDMPELKPSGVVHKDTASLYNDNLAVIKEVLLKLVDRINNLESKKIPGTIKVVKKGGESK